MSKLINTIGKTGEVLKTTFNDDRPVKLDEVLFAMKKLTQNNPDKRFDGSYLAEVIAELRAGFYSV